MTPRNQILDPIESHLEDERDRLALEVALAPSDSLHDYHRRAGYVQGLQYALDVFERNRGAKQ